MRRSFFGSLVLGVAFLSMLVTQNAARADLIQYHVVVDTHTLAGQTVSLFFAASGYNTGPGSAIGNVATVSNFATDATLQFPATPFGLTTGNLPSTVLLPFNHENSGINAKAQYSIDAVLGNNISFNVSLQGDQLGGTNFVPYAGFEFSVFRNGSQIWLDPSGFASAEVYQLDGVLGFESAPNIQITAIPESGKIALLAGLAMGAVLGGRRLLRLVTC